MATTQTNILLWHYQCPDCGVGDGETGQQVQTHAIYCEVCLEDGRHVRLRRWQVDQDSGALAG
jgi:late competence protein required for DNA uptake (superfamily II DNA/RNA helicase)